KRMRSRMVVLSGDEKESEDEEDVEAEKNEEEEKEKDQEDKEDNGELAMDIDKPLLSAPQSSRRVSKPMPKRSCRKTSTNKSTPVSKSINGMFLAIR
ncbi:hypothetical protein MPER_14725, partial [Moniliophthora perniciosa FA553]